MSPSLLINEIFLSLQGETRTVGIPTIFVRLTGCPLRCSYCDTTYAFTNGSHISIESIVQRIAEYKIAYVTITGGEPLIQPNSLILLRTLCNAGYQVSLETSGAFSIAMVDQRVSRVLDFKTPDSGEDKRNLYANIHHLTPHDQVKFVLCSRQDYDWAKTKLHEYNILDRCEVLLSPVTTQLDSHLLAEWIIEDRLNVRLQLQLHKLLWKDTPGR